MKRTLKKRIFAITMAMTVAASTNVFAATVASLGEQAAIDMPSEVKDPVLDMILPTANKTQLDPFMLAPIAAKSQISANGDLAVINMSNIPIVFAVKATVSSAGISTAGVVLKSSASAVTTNDLTKTTKEAFLSLVPLVTAGGIVVSGAATTAPAFDFTLGHGTFATNTALMATVAPEHASSAAARVSFALDKAAYDVDGSVTTMTGLGTAPTKNYAAFAFNGVLNPNADWADGDIDTQLIYDIKGMSDVAYQYLSTAGLFTVGAHNTIGVTSAENAGGGGGGGASVTSVTGGTYSKAAKVNVVFNLNKGTATAIKEVKLTDSTSTVRTWAPATLIATNGTLTVDKVTLAGTGVINTWANGTVNVVITLTTPSGDVNVNSSFTIAN